jgi:hypothetical protein
VVLHCQLLGEIKHFKISVSSDETELWYYDDDY